MVIDIEVELDHIRPFIDKGNYHAAMNLTISAMNQCRRENDQAGTDRFLELIQEITDIMATQFGSKA